jgi:Zn2+/Cd2+-exporting ATPase
MAVDEAKFSAPLIVPRGDPALTEPMRMTHIGTEETGETWWDRWRLVVAAVSCWSFLIVAFVLDHATAAPHELVLGLYAGAYISGGTFAAIEAIGDLFHGEVNVDLLMVAAAIGAAIVGAWAEGAVLLGLFSTSNALEHFALGRTQHAVKALMDLSPDVATVMRSGAPGGEVVVPVGALTLSDVVLVRPGERIAVDGTVTGGESAVDQAAITGESMPVAKRIGDGVFAGTINGNGAMQVRVTKLAQESTLSRIIAIVEQAREQKSQTQRFTDAFEGKYAIGVILVSTLVAILPPLVGDTSLHDSFYRAMTLLVVASPCALVISTPASTLSALANAARHGILFKGSNHLENAGTVQTVAFDKTGTLTEGRPRVTGIVALNGTCERELLRLTASAERLSEHHIAEAVLLAAQEQGLTLSDPTDFRAIPGKGVVAHIDGCEVIIGNEMLLAELGVETDSAATTAIEQLRAAGNSAIFIANGRTIRGVIAVADTIRPQAAAAVRELKRLGIQRTVMLTGDNQRVADAIAAQVGVDEVQADLLPEEKLDTIRELMKSQSVAMIGDGVNDAPALATATIGIAMGAAGTDVALETADVVLMADDLSKLPYAISLSRRTRRTIIQNLAFSLSVIAILVTAALTIGIPLPLGVVGHEGSTIIVVTNGLRLLRTRE